jgi:hypothetical protein
VHPVEIKHSNANDIDIDDDIEKVMPETKLRVTMEQGVTNK